MCKQTENPSTASVMLLLRNFNIYIYIYYKSASFSGLNESTTTTTSPSIVSSFFSAGQPRAQLSSTNESGLCTPQKSPALPSHTEVDAINTMITDRAIYLTQRGATYILYVQFSCTAFLQQRPLFLVKLDVTRALVLQRLRYELFVIKKRRRPALLTPPRINDKSFIACRFCYTQSSSSSTRCSDIARNPRQKI